MEAKKSGIVGPIIFFGFSAFIMFEFSEFVLFLLEVGLLKSLSKIESGSKIVLNIKKYK